MPPIAVTPLGLYRCNGHAFVFPSKSAVFVDSQAGFCSWGAKVSTGQKRQLEPLWHRVQTEKSSPPNARWLLWQVAQLVLLAEAR